MAKNSKRFLANIKNTSVLLVALMMISACSNETDAAQQTDGPTRTQNIVSQNDSARNRPTSQGVISIRPMTPEEQVEHKRTVDSLRREAYAEAMKTLKEQGEQALNKHQKQIIREFQAEQNEK